jgi:O-antigen/teichoic acid export membrane protein
VEQYGNWILLSTIPSWISLSSFSLGSVSSNVISLHASSGRIDAARQVYSTTVFVLAIIFTIGSVVVLVIAALVHVAPLSVTAPRWADSDDELRAVALLSLSVLVGFFAEPFLSRLRAVGKADVGIVLSAVSPWIETACMIVAMALNLGLSGVAAAVFIGKVVFCAIVWLASRAAHPAIHFRAADVQPAMVPGLIRSGMAFQAFPLGQALCNQALLLAVDAAMGATAVAVFATARTIARLGIQLMELVTHSVWPEISLLIGSAQHAKAAMIHRMSAAATIVIGCLALVGVSIAGPALMHEWSLHTMKASHALMALVGLSILLHAMWIASLMVQLAANEHEPVAARFVVGAALSAAACYPLTVAWGLYGAAASSLIVEVVMIPYTLRRALTVTQDTLGPFVGGLVPALQAGLGSIVARRRRSLEA